MARNDNAGKRAMLRACLVLCAVIAGSFAFGRALGMKLMPLQHIVALITVMAIAASSFLKNDRIGSLPSRRPFRIAVVCAALALVIVFHAVKDTLFSPFGLSQSECNYLFQGYTALTKGKLITPWNNLPDLFPTFDQGTGWCLLGFTGLCIPFFALLGYSHSTVVLVTLLAKVAIFFLMLEIFKKLRTPFWIGLAATFLTLVIWPTTLGRPEEAALPFGLAGVLFLIRSGDDTPSVRDLCLAGLFFGLAMQFHLSAVAFFLPVSFSLVFFQYCRSADFQGLFAAGKALAVLSACMLVAALPSILYIAANLPAVEEQYFGVAKKWAVHSYSTQRLMRFFVMVANNLRASYDSSPFFLPILALIAAVIPPLRLRTLRERFRASAVICILVNLGVISLLSMHGYEYLFCFTWTMLGAAALFPEKMKTGELRSMLSGAYVFMASVAITAATIHMTFHGLENMRRNYARTMETCDWLSQAVPRDKSVTAKEIFCYVFKDHSPYYASIFPFESDKVDYAVLSAFRNTKYLNTVGNSFKSRLPVVFPYERYRDGRKWLHQTMRNKYTRVGRIKAMVPTEYWEQYGSFGYIITRKRNDLP